MSLDEMEVGSPQWEAEVERLQAEEDAGADAARVKAEAEAQAKVDADEKAKAEEAEAAKPAAAAQAKDEPEKPAVPSGILSKDGKTVLPYAALKGARTEAKAERTARLAAEAKAAEFEKELVDMRAGKKPSETELSPEEMADLEAYAPKAAAAIKEASATKERLAELERKPKPVAAEPEDDPVQEAIDQLPLLAGWQASDPEKFARAVALDEALKGSPKWKGSTPEALAKRFGHVTKLVAEEFDIQIQDDKPQTKEPSNKADPEEVISKATRTAPNTLSDFKGGAVDQNDQRMDRMSPLQQLSRVSDMGKAEFEQYLAKLG